ncbi:MAG: glycosyltransferase [Planctomycetes bacterium]|nr:glycosyltransferase [Planctomycetota bacterium]
MSSRDTLYLVPALEARACDGAFELTKKFLDGVCEYVKRWDGPVVVLLGETRVPSTNLDTVHVAPADVPFGLAWRPQDDAALVERLADARLVLATLVDRNTRVAQLCAAISVPVVYITEYSFRTRCQIIRAETVNPVLRWRRQRWTKLLERRYQRAVRLAEGVQCNGTPTFNAYRSINPRPMLYFDSRVRREMLACPKQLEHRTAELMAGGPLRLVFSGRMVPMKGVDHLPLVAAELDRLGVPFVMDICGAGPQADRIAAKVRSLNLTERVQLHGVLEFESELLPYVSRNADLFICCHRQGDPSCTYLETMACGVPMIGYDNEALRGIVETSGVGWITPLDKPKQLAQKIAQLNRDRASLADAATAAVAFASRHTLEPTMDARVEHLEQCSQRLVTGAAA